MRLLLALFLFLASLRAAPQPPSWTLVENADFQIYSQAGDTPDLRRSLLWFEQLRAFFAGAGLPQHTAAAVRIIGFRSVKDYDSYRLRPIADAYYIGTETRDYIVMPSLDESKFGIAAHEYAHLVLHAGGMRLPPWLNEGLAEFFSTVTIDNHTCRVGGPMRSHAQTLRTHSWLPLARLLESGPGAFATRDESNLFYAESWALTDLLLTSPEFRLHLPALIASLTSGEDSAAALTHTYGRSLATITADVQTYLNTGALHSLTVPGVSVGAIKAIATVLTPFAARSMLAELLLTSGELSRAETLYNELARTSPHDPDISAALGAIALRKGDSAGARLHWKSAMAEGITDPVLCYRYAVLASDAGLPPAEIRPALERAIALNPAFDDARFQLALLESTAGNYQSALNHFQAIKVIAPARAFAYWLATSFAQDQLNQHQASKRSALQALRFAATPQERTEANQLAYIADTDLSVQFTRDANGNLQVSTTRVPRGSQPNPFIEPQDRIRRAEGQLRAVECSNDNRITGVAIDTAAGSLSLAIPDPLHVLIHGASEFTCGPQSPRPVTVEYAVAPANSPTAGTLRGLDLH